MAKAPCQPLPVACNVCGRARPENKNKMRKKLPWFLAAAGILLLTSTQASADPAGSPSRARVLPDTVPEADTFATTDTTATSDILATADTTASADTLATADTVVITLDQALEIALSENVSVKVADKEIERTGYSKKGTYASLYPQIDVSGSYQRAIKKQVMYMGFDIDDSSGLGSLQELFDSFADAGIEVGRANTWSVGITASMPLVNAQLWESLKISGLDVDLAVEKARSSRLDMLTSVKQAFYAVLLAKEAFAVYKDVYENALSNYNVTELKYNAQKATEMELLRAKTSVANAVPNVYNAESSVIIALWQLKAVLGVDLDMNLDVAGSLDDYADHLFYDLHRHDEVSLDHNSSLRQLSMQAEELARNIRSQKYAYIPTLAAQFSYSTIAMENTFKFSQYNWTPYAYVGVSLQIPIFSGWKRWNQVKVARNNYEQLELQRQDTERQLKIAIRQYLTTMETNMNSYYAAVDAVNSAQKGYDISEKSYQVGRSTLIELNDAQLSLTQAKLSVSQAIYNFVVAKAQLEQTIGADFLDENDEYDPDIYNKED